MCLRHGGKRADRMMQHPVAAERLRVISLFLSILYLPAVHLQGREDDGQVSDLAHMFTYSSMAVKFVGGMLMTPA